MNEFERQRVTNHLRNKTERVEAILGRRAFVRSRDVRTRIERWKRELAAMSESAPKRT